MKRFTFADGLHWLRAGGRTMLLYPAGVFVMALGVLSARMLLGPFSFATDALALTAMATLFPDASGVTADEVRERSRLLLVIEASGWGIPAGLAGWLFLMLGVPAVMPLLDDDGGAAAAVVTLGWTALSYAFYYACSMFTVLAVLSAARDGTGFRQSGRAARQAMFRAWRPLVAIYLAYTIVTYGLTFLLAWVVSSLSAETLEQTGLAFVRDGAYAWPVLYAATALFLSMAAPFSSAMDAEPVEMMPAEQGVSLLHFVLGALLLSGAAAGAMLYAKFVDQSTLGDSSMTTGFMLGLVGLFAFIGAMDCFAGRPGRRKWIALIVLWITLASSYNDIRSTGEAMQARAAEELGDTMRLESRVR